MQCAVAGDSETQQPGRIIIYGNSKEGFNYGIVMVVYGETGCKGIGEVEVFCYYSVS